MTQIPSFSAGDRVRVRSATAIAATLDAEGALDGLPFMPEMAALCGRELSVHRRADRTCVEGWGLRAMDRTVLLEAARCDGSAHDGCQRDCLFFWKDAWLEPAETPTGSIAAEVPMRAAPVRRGELYHCQSTALAGATKPLSRWDFRPLLDDVEQGALGWAGLLGFALRTVANKLRALFKLPELGQLAGATRKGEKGDLGLEPGDWVRIRDKDEVRATLDPTGRNRGLTFEPEMTLHVGERHQVDFQVERIILEESGRMVTLNRTVALKDVVCKGACTRNCPRANTLYWRESWLERAEPPATAEP